MKLSKRREENNLLVAESTVALALKTEILDLKTTTGFNVGCIQEIKARLLEIERFPTETQKPIKICGSCEKTLPAKVLQLVEELSAVRINRANPRVNLD